MRPAILLALVLFAADVRPAGALADDDAVLLARVVVSESGWDGWATGDGYAIHEAQLAQARADGVSWRSAAVAMSPRATGRRPTSGRLAWVAGLDERGREPAAWPPLPHSPWPQYRSRWLAVLERAREVVTWPMSVHDEWGMCDERPWTWAAPHHPPSPGLVAVDCGGTRNRYYRRGAR